jgi:hypothetical protein
MYPKCLANDKIARRLHRRLNQIMVGKVLTVEDQIKATLDIRAKMYNHQNCLPNKRPGKIMAILVIKAKNSTVLGLFQ